ncbi:hypothetical protein [Frankia sp. CcWB2]
MEKDETTHLAPGLSVPGQRETGSGVLDGAEVFEPATETFSFGPVANPNRLRLGASRSL